MRSWLLVSIITLGLASRVLASSESTDSHHELVKRIDSDGKVVELYWNSPSAPTKRLPAILYVHGVQDESRPGAINMVNGGLLKLTTDLGFFAAAMSMPGYGQSSGNADFCGRESQAALRSVLKYLRTRSDIEAKDIAVSGLSCGAITAAMIADKEPMAAMILVSGVYDFGDMYNKWQTPEWKLQPEVLTYIQKSVEADGGLKNAAKYRSASPYVKNFKMPILVIAGAKDRIVDPKQSAQLTEAMRSCGHPYDFVFNPDGEHMISYESWAKYTIEFLTEHSKK